MTGWHGYESCPTCRRVTGERCRDQHTRALLDSPHAERPRVTGLAAADTRPPCACCDALGQPCRLCRAEETA